MKLLAMVAIVLICVGFAAWNLSWLAWSLRGPLYAAVLIGLLYVVVRGSK